MCCCACHHIVLSCSWHELLSFRYLMSFLMRCFFVCAITDTLVLFFFFFFSSRRRHTRFDCDWSSDVCSSDLVCPTGAIIRTEFDTVVIQSDVCNGCRACIAACPFGVIDINPVSGTAQKCTLCYDRLKVGLEPACSKACPTDSIQFGTITELRTRAQKRADQLQSQGVKAELYGADPNGARGGAHSLYLLGAEPAV